MNGIQEVSGSIPLSSIMQETWDKLLSDGFSQGVSWLVVGVLIAFYFLYIALQKRSGKISKRANDYKQRVYDRWHDQDDTRE